MPKITETMKRTALISILLLTALTASLFGEVRFSGPDLAEFNTLLFAGTADSPGTGEYTTLFSADVGSKSVRQLSFFPEDIMYLREVEQFQVQNRYGIFRTDKNLKNIQPVHQFPAFVTGSQVQTGKINLIHASPDGRYLLYLEPTSFGYADLTIYDIKEAREKVITEQVELAFNGPNAKWSPNSKFFVYCKQNKIYYYSIDQLEEGRIIAENFRLIGGGTISSVRWNRENSLYYILGSRVYQIFSVEFFTRSIYSGLLEIGTIVGKIPFQFDPNFDSFWISPDGRKILLNKGGRNIFLYFLQNTDYTSTGEITSLPYLFLPRNTRVKRVLWSRNGLLTLLTDSIVDGKGKTTVFRLDLQTEPDNWTFVRTGDTGVRDLVMSPEDRRIAVIYPEKIVIKTYSSWEDEKTLTENKPVKVVWKSNTNIIVAGSNLIEDISLTSEERQLIGFSQIDEYGFAKSSRNIQVKARGNVYELDLDSDAWGPVSRFEVGDPKLYSKEYRVYIEQAYSGSYQNLVKIRDNKGLTGTFSLFDPPKQQYEPFPDREEKLLTASFSHGSRIRRREISLVFNAIDNVEGLTEILNTLSDYQIRATFFVNGEFIRRHPDAVKEIAFSGHEVGSMFYTYFNMTDNRFTVDKEFIKRGLARNEDDYFLATGKELSLLWHAPYYFVNSDIIEASEEMNYTYISRDVDPLDWAAKDTTQSGSGGGLYYPSARIVDRVLEKKKPGSIVPVRIGTTDGERDDYLFHKIDLLLNGLISLGYKVVPVSTLMEHAK